MAQIKISSTARLGLGLAFVALLAGCAPSPLYFSNSKHRPGTGGEIPRDGRGEPIWSAITAPSPLTASETPPASFAPLPPAPRTN
ncbi:MAG: hypothetical protein ACRCUI_00760 [Polymorphobacter sp.]